MVYIWVCSLHKVIKDSEYTNVPIDDTCVCFLKLDSSSSLSLSLHSSTILLSRISPFVFHGRKKVRGVWNGINKMSKPFL